MERLSFYEKDKPRSRFKGDFLPKAAKPVILKQLPNVKIQKR